MSLISESSFKALLDMVWHTIMDTSNMINALESIGLDVNPSDKNNQPVPFGGLYKLQSASTAMLLDSIGVGKDFKNGGNTRSTILEDMDQFLFDLYTTYPDSEKFPEEGYQEFFNIFTTAGVKLPWDSTSLMCCESVRKHRGIVMCNYMPAYGYVWQGASHTYIIPHSNGINYDEENKRLDTFALEVFPETVTASLNTTDTDGIPLYDGDTVSADGEEFTLKSSEPETLCRLASYHHNNIPVKLVRPGYQEFLHKHGRK